MSSTWPDWQQLLLTAVGLSPYWLALLLGAALCLRNASLQPRRAALVGIGLGLTAVSMVAGFLLTGYVFETVHEQTGSIQTAMIATQLTASLPSAVSLLLLVWAAFYGDRQQHSGE